MPTVVELAERAARVRARVAQAAERSRRAATTVTIVAVTKTVPPEVIRSAHALGFAVFGENRVQEAAEKIAELHDLPGVRWELIGHLQSNKVARAVDLFERIQSVDSVRLAELLDARAGMAGRQLPILLEVNVAGETSKSGVAPDALIDAAQAIARLPHLYPGGLMTVAPIAPNAEDVRPVFRRLRELRDAVRNVVSPADGRMWCELSMGMSDDFDVAVEEGATIVRLGRALFGERPAQRRESG